MCGSAWRVGYNAWMAEKGKLNSTAFRLWLLVAVLLALLAYFFIQGWIGWTFEQAPLKVPVIY